MTLNEEMQREFARQRDHLERTLAGVRKKLAKDTAIHKNEFIRIMHASSTLFIKNFFPVKIGIIYFCK